MQFLKFTECLDYIIKICKLLSLLTEFCLNLKVFLEIKIAELAVDLDHIIELLHIELISLIDIPVALNRYRSDSLPSVLDFTECRESRIHILLLLKKSLQVSNNSLLKGKILLAFLIKLPVIFGTFLLISII